MVLWGRRRERGRGRVLSTAGDLPHVRNRHKKHFLAFSVVFEFIIPFENLMRFEKQFY